MVFYVEQNPQTLSLIDDKSMQFIAPDLSIQQQIKSLENGSVMEEKEEMENLKKLLNMKELEEEPEQDEEEQE